MRKILTIFITFILVAGIVSLAESTNIDDGANIYGIREPKDRKIVKSSTTARIVVLYQNGELVAKRSIDDGSSWKNLAGGTDPPFTTIDATPSSCFSICMDASDNIYVTYEETDSIYFRKLTYSGGNWTVGAQETVDYDNVCANPSIIRESGGKVWIVYGCEVETSYGELRAAYAIDPYSSWSYENIVSATDGPVASDFQPALVLRNNYPFVVFNDLRTGEDDMKSYAWFGSSWSYTGDAAANDASDFDFSVTTIGNDVHFVYNESGGNIYHRYYNGSWNTGGTLSEVANDRGVSLTTEEGGTDLWCFISSYTATNEYNIVYKKRSDGTWDASWTAITNDSLYNRFSATPLETTSYIPLAWMVLTSPYPVKYNLFDFSPPPAPEITSSSHPTEGTWYSDDHPYFNWTCDDTSGITGYSYEWDHSPTTTPNTSIDTTGTSKDYPDVDDGTWYFHVRARNGSGIWGEAEHYQVNIDATAPGAPTITSLSHPIEGTWYSNNDPSFDWSGLSDTSGITGYSYVWDHSPTTTPNTTSEGPETYKDYTDEDDGTWYFHVRARNGSNLWGLADHYQVNIDATPPGTPQNVDDGVEGSSNDNMPTFTWDSVTDTSGVDGYWCAVDDNTPESGGTWTTTLSSTTAPLSDGTYTFYVKAENGAGLYSVSPGSHTCVIDTTAPAAITDLSGQHETGDVILSWSTPGDDGWNNTLPSGSKYIIDYSSYSIQWSTSTYDVEISTSGVAPHTEVSHTITDLQEGTTWYFQIWTRDEVPNWSGLSNGATVWIPALSQTYNWDGGGDTGVWEDADNWDVGGSYPDDANDKAIINIGSESISTPGSALTIGELELGSSYSGTLTLGNNLTLDDSGEWDGSGSLTISNANATLYLVGYNLTIPGTFSNNGTLKLRGGQTLNFTNDTNSGTVEYVGDGDTAEDTYTLLDSGTTDYYHLTINSTDGATDTFRPDTTNLIVAGNFTLSTGTFTTEDETTTDRNLSVTGNVDIDGTFTANSSTITVSGNWDSDGGTFTYGTHTVDLKGTGTVTVTSSFSGPFYNLTCAYPDKTTTLTVGMGIRGTLRVKGGTLTTTGTPRIYLHDDITPAIDIVDGSTISVYRLQFDGPQTVPGYNYGSSILTVWNSGTVTQGGDVTCTALWVHGDNFANRSPTWDTAGYSLTINGGLLVGGTGGSNGGTHTFNANGSTITVSGSVTLNHLSGSAYLNLDTSNMSVAGNWTITNGSVNPGTSTVTFDSNDTGKTITSNGQSFANVVFDSENNTGEWTLQDALTCESNLQIVDKKLIDTNQTVTVNGDIIIANASGRLDSLGTGTWIQGADGNISNPWWWDNVFKVLQIAAGVTSTRTGTVVTRKLVLGANATLTSQTIESVSLAFPTVNDFIDMGSGSDVTGGAINITPHWIPGTKTQKAISVSAPVYIGNISSATIKMTGNWTTGNLTIHGASGATTETAAALLDTNGNNLTVNGNLTLGWSSSGHYGKILLSSGTHSIIDNVGVGSSGDTHGYFDLGSADISIGGNCNFSRATVTPGTSTVTLNGSGTQTVTSDGESFYHLVINSTDTSVQLQDAADIDGGLTISTGTLDLNSYDITISSDVSISGSGSLTCSSGEQITVGRNWSASSGATFTAASSTTTFNGTGSFNILSSGTTFYNLLFNNNVSTWTLTDALYGAGDFTLTSAGNVDSNDKNLTIAGDFTVNGGKFTAGVSTMTVAGNWDSSGGTFNYEESTVDLTGTGNLKTPGGWNGTYFYNLKVAAANKTTTMLSHVGVADTLTLGNATGTLTDGASSFNVTLWKNSGAPLSHGGATTTISRIIYRPSDGTVTVTGEDYGISYLELYPSASGAIFNLGGDVTVPTGTFWLLAPNGTSNVVCNTQNYSLTANCLLFGWNTSYGSTTLNCGTSTIDIDTSGVDMVNNAGSHTLNLSSATVTCAGNWELVDGTGTITQIPGTSTVMFDNASSTSTLTGSTTFYGLVSTASGKNVKVSSDTVIDVTGHLNFENIILRSTLNGATWYLNLSGSGTQDVSGVDVQDSNASGGSTIYAVGASTDSGNNTNWVFSGAGLTLIWTGVVNSTFSVAGNWNPQFSPTATSNIIIPNTATKPKLEANTSINGLNINEGGARLELNSYNLTISSYVTLAGTMTCTGTEQITVGGGWDATGGYFDAGQSTTTFNGSGSFDILSSGTTFYNLAFSNSVSTWTLTDALYLDGDFTITNSSGNVASNDKNLTIAGDFTVNGGNFKAGVSTITVAGDWDTSVSANAFTWDTSTVDLTGNGTINIYGTGVSYYFHNLKCAAAGKTTELLNRVGVNGYLELGSGTLIGSGKTMALRAAGTPFVHNNPTIALQYFTYRSLGGTITVTGGDYGSVEFLTLQPSGSNRTYNFGGDITNNGTLHLLSGGSFTGNVVNTEDYDLKVKRLMFGVSWYTGEIPLNCGTSTIDIGTLGLLMLNNGGSHTLNLDSATVTCAGDWKLVSGTGSIDQDPGTSTVIFDNASNTSTLTGSTTFYVLISTTSTKTVQVSSDTVIGVTNHLNFENITLQSTSPGATWYLNLSGTQDVSNVDVRDSNASGSADTIIAFTSTDSGNNTEWDFGPPEAITDLTGECDSQTGDVTLYWSTPGDDYNWQNTLVDDSKYRIDYSSYSIAWSTSTFDLDISTHSVAPHTQVSRTITGLTADTTWYFQIWTADEIPLWSGLSNGATVWVTVIVSSVTVSAHTSGDPDVPPTYVYTQTTNCLGTFRFEGGGTISSMTITEYGTCDANSELDEVKLFKDNGNGDWNSGDDTTQLGTTMNFNTSDKATFSGFSLAASTYCYVHVVLDVKSTADSGGTVGIELYQNDIVCTSTTTASSWPVQLGTSIIGGETTPPSFDNSSFESQKSDDTWISTSDWNDDLTPNTRVKVQDTGTGLRIGSSEVSPDTHTVLLMHLNNDTTDYSGHGNNGTREGEVVWIPTDTWKTIGGTEPILYFDGNNDYVDCGTASSLDMGSGDFTIMAWFKTSDMTATVIAGKGGVFTNGKRYFLGGDDVANNKLYFVIDDDGAGGSKRVESTLTYNDGNWHQAIGVRDGNNLRLYIDGVEDANSPVDITGYGNIDSIRPCTIGSMYNENTSTQDWFFNGLIDEVRVLDRALTADEIAADYYSGLFKYSKDEGSTWYSISGSTVAWSTGTVTGANESTIYETIHASNVPFNQYSGTQNKIKFLVSDMQGNIAVSSPYTVMIGSITVSAYTDGDPDVPPSTVGQGTTENCLGTYKFDGTGTISQLIITEYGTCDAENELENVELFKDDNGNGNWESGQDTTLLGSTTNFNSSDEATFSEFSLVASTYCYVHVVLDVKSNAQVNNTIGIKLYQNHIVCTSTTTASNWPVQLSSSTIKDLTPPAAITDLTGLCDSDTGDVTLSWSTPGDDEWENTLASGSQYIIDYSSYSIQWSTENYKVGIPTHSVAPHTKVSRTITGLTGDTTWYFQIWTRDEVPNWSGLSNGATIWVNPILSVSISTNTYDFGDVPMGQSTHTVSVITVTNEGNVNETYSLKISSVTLYDNSPSLWKSTNTTTGHNRFIFYAIFHGVQVSTSNFDSDDYVIDENRASTADCFSDNDGGGDKQTGINVPKGDDRKLWFRLDMPTSTTTGKEEKITVTITAGPE